MKIRKAIMEIISVICTELIWHNTAVAMENSKINNEPRHEKFCFQEFANG